MDWSSCGQNGWLGTSAKLADGTAQGKHKFRAWVRIGFFHLGNRAGSGKVRRMFSSADALRRWLGMFCLAVAAGLLIWGQTILKPYLEGEQLKPGCKKSFKVKGKLDGYSISQVSLLPMGNEIGRAHV